MTLGQFIKKLESIPDLDDKHIAFDFAYLAPGTFDSYRGDYSQLALSFNDKPKPNASEILMKAKACLGSEFEGYKGGTYQMKEETDLYAANWGYPSNTKITGIHDYHWIVIIKTQFEGEI